MKTLAQARLNRPFNGKIELIQINGAGAYVLPQALSSYRLRLYHHAGTTHFAEASIANAKMTISNTGVATVIDFAFPATDLALASKGYGSLELVSTVDNQTVVQPPVMYLDQTMPYTSENGEKLAIFDEKIVCVIASSVSEYILGPTTVAVNVLPAGSAGSGTYDGNTLTLNLPRGDTGSNGVLSAAEVARGSLALEAASPDLLGRKAYCLDLVGGGFAHLDDAAAHVLASVENIAGVTLTATAGSFSTGRKGLQVAATANRLRYSHLASGLPQGALFEAAATNLILQSQNFASGWTLFNATLAATTAPDGSTSASLLTDDTTNAAHRINRNTTTISGTTYCASIFVKAGSLSRVQLSRASGGSALFNLATGTVQSSTGATLVGAGITALNGGWYRIWIADNAAFTTFNFLLNLSDASGNTAFAGTGAGQIAMWGAQLEEGSVPTSYMPTTTAAVLRAADQLLVPVSGVNLLYTSLAAEFVMPPPVSTGTRIICQLRGDSNNRLLFQLMPNNAVLATFVGNGTSVNLTLSATPVVNSLIRVAASVDMGSGILRGKASGVAAPADAALAVAPVLAATSLHVGSNSGSASFLQAGVRRVIAVDRAWTASEIAGFTG